MSKQSLAVAESFGQQLPTFSGQAEAEASLYAMRDHALAEIMAVRALHGQLDYTPESLDPIERWFFSAGQPIQLGAGFSVAHTIGFYFGEVFCRSAGFTWTVQEFAFGPGRYGIGVTRGLSTIMLTMGRVPTTINNKRMQSLHRTFDRYTSNNG